VEPQSWRNPRPAPTLNELRAKTPAPRLLVLLGAWWPALVWAGVIFTMSTDTFSGEHTASFFEPILRWIRPSLTVVQFAFIHHLIRKSAHFTEYFVFCLLLYRGVRSGRIGWSLMWGFNAFFIAAGYSVLDEIHQAFVPSRGPSAYDSLLDSTGALVAVVVLWLWFRLRGASNHTDSSSLNSAG